MHHAPADTLSVVDLVWPDQSNHHGTLFGGAALAMLDRLAFILGSRVLRGSVVTAAVGRLDFQAPAPAGHLVEVTARVTKRGGRSVDIATELIAEDLLSGARTPCLSGEFVMASLKDSIPDQVLATPNSDWPVRIAEIVFPGHTNHRGLLHGGPAMEWLAKAGFVAATRESRRTVVMASSERLDFVAPAHVGEVVEVLARVVRMGNRSIAVEAEMWAEQPVSGERRLCTRAALVYVAVP